MNKVQFHFRNLPETAEAQNWVLQQLSETGNDIRTITQEKVMELSTKYEAQFGGQGKRPSGEVEVETVGELDAKELKPDEMAKNAPKNEQSTANFDTNPAPF